MFGGKSKGPTRVGAREKILKAKMHMGGQSAHIESQREGGKGKTSPAVLATTYYVMSCALAFVLAQGPLKNGAGNLGWLDTFWFGVPSGGYMGDPLYDAIIVSLINGISVLVITGLLPFLTLVWIKLRDNPNMNPLLTVWGVSIGLLLLMFGGELYVVPFAADVFKQLTSG